MAPELNRISHCPLCPPGGLIFFFFFFFFFFRIGVRGGSRSSAQSLDQEIDHLTWRIKASGRAGIRVGYVGALATACPCAVLPAFSRTCVPGAPPPVRRSHLSSSIREDAGLGVMGALGGCAGMARLQIRTKKRGRRLVMLQQKRIYAKAGRRISFTQARTSLS